MLGDQRCLDVHITTIHRALEHAGISLKKLQKIAAERDPLARADYIRCISRYRSDQLVFIDDITKPALELGTLAVRLPGPCKPRKAPQATCKPPICHLKPLGVRVLPAITLPDLCKHRNLCGTCRRPRTSEPCI
jgi:hypothetical protein